MFEEFSQEVPLRAIYWKDLRPGLAFAGGLTVNGGVPPELAGHPVLDSALIHALHDRYRLNPDKKVLLLGGEGGLSAAEWSEALRKAEARLAPLGRLRHRVRGLKQRQPQPELPVWESSWVQRGTLIWPLAGGGPSLLAQLSRDIGLAEVLNREAFTRFNLPVDRPAALHLVVDTSYSMEASCKDEVSRTAIELFRATLAAVLPLAEIRVYAFSEECRVVEGALAASGVRRAGTDFSSFARAALRHRRPDRPNALLLFTDGLPERRAEALRGMELLREAGFFYTQIIFNLAEDRRSYALDSSEEKALDGYFKGDEPESALELTPEEYRAQEAGFREGFIELARAAGGNQLIITVDEALSLAAIEVFDRWYGDLAG